MRFLRLAIVWALVISCESDSTVDLQSGTGQAGSMTRFAIAGNHLYLLESTSTKVLSLSDSTLVAGETVDVDSGMETIFANGEYLDLGASNGMYIYTIADPARPAFVFQYEHIVACDPVVVQGNRAYITMRS